MNPALQAAIAATMQNKETPEAVHVSAGACFATLLIVGSVAASVVALIAFL